MLSHIHSTYSSLSAHFALVQKPHLGLGWFFVYKISFVVATIWRLIFAKIPCYWYFKKSFFTPCTYMYWPFFQRINRVFCYQNHYWRYISRQNYAHFATSLTCICKCIVITFDKFISAKLQIHEIIIGFLFFYRSTIRLHFCTAICKNDKSATQSLPSRFKRSAKCIRL